MSSEFPQSAQEAEQHIRQIRREKGLSDRQGAIANNAADLEAALQVLSIDLYQTTTHFLLELIQNADDNKYNHPDVPTLRVTQSSRRLRIDCNERGFSRQNVEAICRICKSTKSGRSKAAGFVGEKGIGFKAVFKVASTVSIASGHYQFKFTRNGHLGMIAPIWSPFPDTVIPGWTSIILDLDDDCDEAAIADELRRYDARILMFLRRLCRLEINVNFRRKRWNVSSPPTAKFNHVFTRQGQEHGYSSYNPSIMSLGENDELKQYLVWRHTANKLPVETRRPGITSSEVILAFPLGNDAQTPEIAPQSVYAFLPIREYGLDFLIHADFLLATNREEIMIDSPWNKALASAIAVALVDAAVYMSGLPERNRLRYHWISYLPRNTPINPLIKDIRWEAFQKLRETPVIHSQQVGREKKKPTSLTIIPELYCDHKGIPFMGLSRSGEFVSPEYAWIYNDGKNCILTELGVKTMWNENFMANMVRLLQKDAAGFYQNKSLEWHASFCHTLHTIVIQGIQRSQLSETSWQDSPAAKFLLQLPVIPLRRGSGAARWSKALEKTWAGIYYEEISSGAARIPEGIQIEVVDPEAARNPNCRRLFDLLGVKTMGDANIRSAILSTHLSDTFKPESLQPHVLASHLIFLFNSGWTLSSDDTCDFWVAPKEGKCRRASNMYLPSNVPGAACKMLPPAGPDTAYGFLHPSYMEIPMERENQAKWMEWLQKNTRIAVYPRIYNPEWPKSPIIHPDFQRLLETKVPSLKFLELLRDGWDYYKTFLDESSINVTNSPIPSPHVSQLKSLIGETLVPCKGSASAARLKSAYIPYDSLIVGSRDLVPFLDLPDWENRAWEPVIKGLNIRNRPCLEFYLDCLRGCKDKSDISAHTVFFLMANIQTEAATGLEGLRRAFHEEKLIFIPAEEKGGGTHTWVGSGQCVWKGEPWMAKFHVLQKHYPDLGNLFQSSLMIQDTGMEHIVQEAIAIPETDAATRSTTRIQALLLALTYHLVQGNGSTLDGKLREQHKSKLLCARMFPIVLGTRNQPFERLAAVKDKEPWLIADRAIFRTLFRGVLPVLALDAEFLIKIQPLLVALGLRDRFLSRISTNVTEAHGQVTLLEDITGEYQRRSEFLFRLMPLGQPDQAQLRSKFRSIEVFSAETITQFWRAPLGVRQVQSKSTTGQAFLESDYFGDLRIYIPVGYESEPYPFELAEQLREFFSIAVEHRDLVLLVLSGKLNRIQEVFSSRSIGNLIDENADGELATADDAWRDGEGSTVGDTPGRDNKQKSQGSSRIGRILNPKRFHPSFFKEGDGSSEDLPSYSAAVARTTHGAASSGTGRPRRKLPPIFTLPSLQNTIQDVQFHQKDGAIVGEQPKTPPSVLGFLKGLAQRDVDVGEMIVSNALRAILGPQYDADVVWSPRNKRKPGHSAFSFSDSQGRFGSFLMRLEGRTGKAQGYTKLTYYLDVKVSQNPESGDFELTQAELDKARQFSVHSEEPSDMKSNKQVSVLVHISNVRVEPKILFLVDPWDLISDKQLILETDAKYRATLRLRSPDGPGTSQGADDAGFDTVQFGEDRSPRAGPADEEPPAYADRKGKGVSTGN